MKSVRNHNANQSTSCRITCLNITNSTYCNALDFVKGQARLLDEVCKDSFHLSYAVFVSGVLNLFFGWRVCNHEVIPGCKTPSWTVHYPAL